MRAVKGTLYQTGRQLGKQMCQLIGLLFLFLFTGCHESASAVPPPPTYGVKVLGWMDSGGLVSASELESMIHKTVVQELPPLKIGDSPLLFFRGSLRADNTDSVMILESRFLFTTGRSGASIPVKVVVMGSVTGETLEKRSKLINGVLTDVRRGLRSSIRICNGTKQTWMAALDSPEADEQILAMTLLQMHGVRDAASRVIELLSDPRAEVGAAAAESAAILADRSHVDRIIDIAHKGGIEVEARCVQVLSQVGGPDARAWLEMLAVGHENSQMRELGFNALKRLK